jgi:hypothetical protein
MPIEYHGSNTTIIILYPLGDIKHHKITMMGILKIPNR